MVNLLKRDNRKQRVRAVNTLNHRPIDARPHERFPITVTYVSVQLTKTSVSNLSSKFPKVKNVELEPASEIGALLSSPCLALLTVYGSPLTH